MAQIAANDDLAQHEFRALLGREVLSIRRASGTTQTLVGKDIFGWNKQAVSKLELGELHISLYDYLRYMYAMRDFAPEGHPGVELAARLLGKRPRRPAVR